MKPAEHLPDADSSLLSSMIPYAIAPKADGQRIIMLLQNSPQENSPAIRLDGLTRPAIGGFALDVEKAVLAFGQQLYLAFCNNAIIYYL
jgi:hypothetical protein